MTEMASATTNLPHVMPSAAKSATSDAPPMAVINAGMPFEKTVIAIDIAIPSTPHTTMRGNTPNVGLVYLPVDMREPSISPRVERMANLRNAIIIAWSALNVLYHAYSSGERKKGTNIASITRAK